MRVTSILVTLYKNKTYTGTGKTKE